MSTQQNSKRIIAILLSVFLLSVCVCEGKLRKEQKIGGWTEQTLSNSDYKLESNSSDPLHTLYKNLLQYLEKLEVSNINFTKVQSQLVNGVNYKIEFSYEQNNQIKSGKAKIYLQSWTNTCEIQSITLQKDNKKENSTSPFGGWSDYPIESNYQNNVESPLYMAYSFLNEILAKKNIEFVKFDNILFQVVNGLNFRIQFTYKINNDYNEVEEKRGECIIYVNSLNRMVKITELSLLNNEEAEEENNEQEHLNNLRSDNDSTIGGWSNYEYSQDYQTNEQNELHKPFNLLNEYLKKHSRIFGKFIKIQRQLVNGFNYKIRFTYHSSKNTSDAKLGEIIVYVPFQTNDNSNDTEKPKITSVKLNIKEEKTINKEEKEGGWQEYNYQDSNNNDEQSPFYQANSALKNALTKKGFNNLKINRVQSQLVSGVNYKIYFSYYNLKKEQANGYAIIYVQPWTNTIKITDIKFNVQEQHTI